MPKLNAINFTLAKNSGLSLFFENPENRQWHLSWLKQVYNKKTLIKS